MKRTATILVLAGALLGATATPSAAATFGEYLFYCVGGSPEIDTAVRDSALGACGVKQGNKAACSVESGTPWVCATGQAENKPDQQCDYHELRFEISAALSLPGGSWTVSGTAKATYKRYSQRKNITTCTAMPVSPPPTGEGGKYSSESGDMNTTVTFKVEGNITVRTPAGINVELNAAAGCARSTNTSFWREASINSCSPSPSPSASPSTSPSTSPTTSPSQPPTSPTSSPPASPSQPPASPSQPPPSPSQPPASPTVSVTPPIDESPTPSPTVTETPLSSPS